MQHTRTDPLASQTAPTAPLPRTIVTSTHLGIGHALVLELVLRALAVARSIALLPHLQVWLR